MFLVFACVLGVMGAIDLCNPNRAPYTPFADGKLKKVLAITRHGDRSPEHTYPGDDGVFDCNIGKETHIYMQDGARASQVAATRRVELNRDKNPFAVNYWMGNCEDAQLTTVGHKQHIALGKDFAAIYGGRDGLLPETYDPKVFALRTTAKHRTIHSLESFLEGLYPIEKRRDVVDIEVETQPYNVETMIPNGGCCAGIDMLQKEIIATESFQALRAEAADLLKKVQTVLQFTTKKDYIYDYLDILVARFCHGLPFPCRDGVCITQADYDALIAQYYKENAYFFNQTLSRLQVGFFMRDFLEDIDAMMSSDVVYHHYSGHDSSLSAILSYIGADPALPIPYASVLVFEIYDVNGEDRVRVVFNNKPIASESCSSDATTCPLSQFKEYLQNLLPDYAECKNNLNARPTLSRKGWDIMN